MRLSSWHVPVEYLSASSIAMLTQCPEQFRLRRIKRMKDPVGIAGFLGTVDHATHAGNFKQKIYSGEDAYPDEMDNLYYENWDRTVNQEAIEWNTSVEEDDTKDLGIKMLMLYHEVVSPSIRPKKVEERFEEKLKGMPVPIIGYPDVETKDRIVERKTASSKVSKPKAKWVMQGRIYSLVIDKPVEYTVVTKQKTPQLVTADDSPAMLLAPDHHDQTRAMIEQAMFSLNDYWIRYGPDNPWPTNGIYHDWMCGYCFAKKQGVCVAWKN